MLHIMYIRGWIKTYFLYVVLVIFISDFDTINMHESQLFWGSLRVSISFDLV